MFVLSICGIRCRYCVAGALVSCGLHYFKHTCYTLTLTVGLRLKAESQCVRLHGPVGHTPCINCGALPDRQLPVHHTQLPFHFTTLRCISLQYWSSATGKAFTCRWCHILPLVISCRCKVLQKPDPCIHHTQSHRHFQVKSYHHA